MGHIENGIFFANSILKITNHVLFYVDARVTKQMVPPVTTIHPSIYDYPKSDCCNLFNVNLLDLESRKVLSPYQSPAAPGPNDQEPQFVKVPASFNPTVSKLVRSDDGQ